MQLTDSSETHMNNRKGFGTLSSLVSVEQARGFDQLLLRSEAARRRREVEEQAKRSRRNLANPASYKWCATKVAQ